MASLYDETTSLQALMEQRRAVGTRRDLVASFADERPWDDELGEQAKNLSGMYDDLDSQVATAEKVVFALWAEGRMG